MVMLISVQSTYFRQLRHPNFIASTWPLPPPLPPSHNGAITQRICSKNLFPQTIKRGVCPHNFGLSVPGGWVFVYVCVCAIISLAYYADFCLMCSKLHGSSRFEWGYVPTHRGLVQISTGIRADTDVDTCRY